MAQRVFNQCIGAIALVVLGVAVPAPVWAQAPDVVYHNAQVVTINAAFEIAEAVAVANGLIVGVGSNEKIKALAGARTTLVDLGGKPPPHEKRDPTCRFRSGERCFVSSSASASPASTSLV